MLVLIGKPRSKLGSIRNGNYVVIFKLNLRSNLITVSRARKLEIKAMCASSFAREPFRAWNTTVLLIPDHPVHPARSRRNLRATENTDREKRLARYGYRAFPFRHAKTELSPYLKRYRWPRTISSETSSDIS